MNNSTNSIKRKNWFFELMLFLFLLHSVPIIGFMTPAVVYVAIVVLLFISTFFYIGGSLFISYIVKIIPLSILYFLGFLLKMFPVDLTLFTDVYGYLQVVICFVIGQHVLNSNNYFLAKRLALVIVLIYVITSITTTIGCITNPMTSRFLATEAASKDADYGMFMLMNIGGFDFVYTLVLFLPLLMGCVKNKIINRIVVLAIIVLFMATIIETEYATALLFSLLSLFLFVSPKNFNLSKSKYYLIAFVFLILLSRLWLAPFISSMAEGLDSEMLSSRFDEIASIFGSGQVERGTDAGARSELYKKSIQSFYNSPVFGSWSSAEVGGHSLLLDSLARYGLLGLIGYVMLWRGIIRLCLKRFKERKWIGFFYFAIIESIGLSIINPKVFYFFLVLIMPVFIVLFVNKDNKPITDDNVC